MLTNHLISISHQTCVFGHDKALDNHQSSHIQLETIQFHCNKIIAPFENKLTYKSHVSYMIAWLLDKYNMDTKQDISYTIRIVFFSAFQICNNITSFGCKKKQDDQPKGATWRKNPIFELIFLHGKIFDHSETL